MNHGLGKRFYVIDNARTAFVQNKDYRLTGGSERLHKVALVGREGQVVKVAGRLAIRVFTDAGYYNVGVAAAATAFSISTGSSSHQLSFLYGA